MNKSPENAATDILNYFCTYDVLFSDHELVKTLRNALPHAPSTKRYTYRTDAAHGHVDAIDIYAALHKIIAAGEWSEDDCADIADGAWLTIFDADGVPVLRRGTMA